MSDFEYGKIYDIYLPPEFLRLFDGPSCNIMDMWRIFGQGTSGAGSLWAQSSSPSSACSRSPSVRRATPSGRVVTSSRQMSPRATRFLPDEERVHR